MWDLTRELTDGMVTLPGDPPVEIDSATTVEADGYAVSQLALGSHTGTHIDAPAHVVADGRTLGAYDPDRFVFDAVRADCRGLEPRTPIDPARIRPALDRLDAAHSPGDGPPHPCVVVWTGWADHWGTPQSFDHPYLAPETACLCAEHGVAVALDTLSPDPTPPLDAESTDDTPHSTPVPDAERTADSPAFDAEPTDDTPDSALPAHDALLGADCLIVENLCHLAGPPDRFELRAFPLPIDADGAPVRAIAVER